MWKKYSNEIILVGIALNLAFTLVAWTQVQRQLAPQRQGAAGSQQTPFGFPPGAELSGPADGGPSSSPGGAFAIPPDVEKLFKEMNAKTPPPSASGESGKSGEPTSPEQPPKQEEQQKKDQSKK